MNEISSDVIEEILKNNDILVVVGRGKCPCCKTEASQVAINPRRQVYHCFNCGAGGDVFRFVMDRDSVDFLTAAKTLATRCGIQLDEQSILGAT